jgi:hypothetical protein
LRENEDWVELDAVGEIEIISGIQGGWHVEPYLYVSGVTERELFGTATLWVEVEEMRIAESGIQEFEPIFFQRVDDDFALFSQPVIFQGSNTPENLTGLEVIMHADIVFDDGRSVSLTSTVTLIDEFDEFPF